MKKHAALSGAALCLALGLLFPAAASANSSWHWISTHRPYDLLPLVAVVTLAVEVVAVDKLGRVGHFPKTVWLVLLANLLSFGAPYLLSYLLARPIYTFAQLLDRTPIFIVGGWYLLLTLAVEVPLVYNGLKHDIRDRRRLLAVLCLANLVTTVFVALVERTLCHGSW